MGGKGKDHPITMLKEDHTKVKRLFRDFRRVASDAERHAIAEQALQELKIHSVLEEEIFYPAVRRELAYEVMDEADEEHHVAKVLIAELGEMDGTESHYPQKFNVLAENVTHHIEMEESKMLPKAGRLDLDFESLGREMRARKEQLQSTGVPTSAEERMVAAAHGAGDSPAQEAASIATTGDEYRREGRPGRGGK